ncbi:MAG: hypothetical protein F4X91_03615 [Nitrospinae bacterium]|nr:hypothetical protein [Nitrospinota bacterium]
MNAQELLARFPEIPADLHDEEVLVRFAEVFSGPLSIAQKPSACSTDYDAGNHYYMRLINPIGIYRLGLMKREMLLSQIAGLIDKQLTDPSFYETLVPPDVVAREIRGPGCD